MSAVALDSLAPTRTIPAQPGRAALWTGYLGGAVASNLRLHLPLFTYVLPPIYVAIFIWGGLYLRDARVRRVLDSAR